MHRFVQILSLWMARVAGFSILGCALLIAVEVTSRKLFNYSLIGADEISGYVLAFSVTWGASLALVRRAHVRIDVVHAQLPSKVACYLDVLALIAMLSLILLLAWYATELLATNIGGGAISNTTMEIPLWIPQSLWAIGLWLFAGTTIVLIVMTCYHLFRGELSKARAIAGIRSAMEEAQDETHAIASEQN